MYFLSVHAAGLRCNFTVQTIGLADNNITDVGGHALLDLLHYNSSLKEIDLSFNRMSDGGTLSFMFSTKEYV